MYYKIACLQTMNEIKKTHTRMQTGYRRKIRTCIKVVISLHIYNV